MPYENSTLSKKKCIDSIEQILSEIDKIELIFLSIESITTIKNELVQECLKALEYLNSDEVGKTDEISVENELTFRRLYFLCDDKLKLLRTKKKSWTLAFSLLGIAILIIISLFTIPPVRNYLIEIFHAKKIGQYVFLGIAWALCYFLTEQFKNTNKDSHKLNKETNKPVIDTDKPVIDTDKPIVDTDKPIKDMDKPHKAVNMTYQIFISILIPLVLVIIFSDYLGENKDLAAKPTNGLNPTQLKLICFCCGYSTTLVSDLFKKLVDKCRSIIDAI